MKFRFSILTLLALTAWTAVCFAAFRAQMSGWMVVVYLLWFAILAAVAVTAAQRTSPQAVFARGVFLFTLLYNATLWTHDGYFMKETRQWPMPHLLVAKVVLDMDTLSPYAVVISPPGTSGFNFISGEEIDRRANVSQLAFCNVSLAFGLLGGCLALWQYRRREPREPAR